MYRWLRVGLLVVLFASIVPWVEAAHGVAAEGTVYTDTMDGVSTPLLSTESPDASQYLFAYQAGQFAIQTLQPGFYGELSAFTAVPPLADSSAAVDFAIAGDATGKYAFAGCRMADKSTGYQLEVRPATGEVNLWRLDPQNVTELDSVTDTSVVVTGNGTNHIEIRCIGSTVAGSVNGQQLVSGEDANYASGNTAIGTGKITDAADQLQVGFDNLTVTDLGGVAQPAQAPAPPNQVTDFSAPDSSDMGTNDTGQITDPRVDPEATLNDAFMVALSTAPTAGPLAVDADLPAGQFQNLSSGVQLSDFYATFSFTTPPATPADTWWAGFVFWVDGQGNAYDLAIRAKDGAAEWVLGKSSSGISIVVKLGDLPPGTVDFTPGADNDVSIVVYQGVAILSGNQALLDVTVDLDAALGARSSGDVVAEFGFQPDTTSTTQTLPVSLSDFMVWDLSSGTVGNIFDVLTPSPEDQPTQAAIMPTPVPAQPTATAVLPTVAAPTVTPPPSNNADTAVLTQIFNAEKALAMAETPLFSSTPGEIVQALDTLSFVPSGSSVADFYATVTFTNPTDMSAPSDYMIGFRDLNINQEFRFVVRSDGVWGLSVGTETPLVQGQVSNFDATPGATNTLEVLATGSTGILVVNGQVIQQVDLSANLNAGDVYIGSGAYAASSIDQRHVPFSNFSVYQLPA